MDDKRILVLIPARYQSSRFPGKPLAQISGKSMIERVYTNCREAGFETYVVTDHDQIEKHVLSFKGQCLRVDDDVPSGSERIFLAYQRLMKKGGKIDLVMNVQGDEPLLPGKELKRLADFHLKSHFDVTTLVREIKGEAEEFKNPNRVKAILTERGQCLYFSRAPIPYDRDGAGTPARWHLHIGVYSFRPKVLSAFNQASATAYELLEKLEQLRLLESGFNIGGLVTTENLMGVDLPSDIAKIEGVLGGKSK